MSLDISQKSIYLFLHKYTCICYIYKPMGIHTRIVYTYTVEVTPFSSGQYTHTIPIYIPIYIHLNLYYFVNY